MKKITRLNKKKQPKIEVEMEGKGLTVHGGMLPVINFMGRLNFWSAVKKAVNKERGANAIYEIADAVEMIIIGVISGATSLMQVVKVCSDEVLKQMAGWKDVPVDSTLGRIMKTLSFIEVVGLEGLAHRLRGRVWKVCIRSGKKLMSALSIMWVDVDSTVEGVCGNQEGAEKGYNPNKKGQKSYHPLMAFVAETKEVLHSWFRCGSAYTSNGIVEFMKESMSYIKNGVKVIVRGDSGFFSGELLDYLESIGAGYLIKVKMKNLISLLGQQKWISIPKRRGWEQAVFWYQCAGWSHPRRFVAVRQLIGIEKGLIEIFEYAYFCYVTTENLTPIEAHEKYGKRATCETWIEEVKSQMNAGHIITGDFWANAALFQCAVLAYNLLRWMAMLTGGVIQQWEMKTMRLWLIRVAGKLVKGSRQLTLKIPKKFLHQEEWRAWEQMSLNVSFG